MTTAVDIEKIVCRGCYAVLDLEDSFCRHCGVPTGSTPSSSDTADSTAMVAPLVPGPSPGTPPGSPKLTENPWVVLTMLFLVVGPLGLPMLWRSRQFSLVWKVVLTVLVLGLTIAVVAMIWYALQKSLEPLMELRKMKRL